MFVHGVLARSGILVLSWVCNFFNPHDPEPTIKQLIMGSGPETLDIFQSLLTKLVNLVSFYTLYLTLLSEFLSFSLYIANLILLFLRHFCALGRPCVCVCPCRCACVCARLCLLHRLLLCCCSCFSAWSRYLQESDPEMRSGSGARLSVARESLEAVGDGCRPSSVHV